MEELVVVPDWGWQRDRGSWFQRHGEGAISYFLERMMTWCCDVLRIIWRLTSKRCYVFHKTGPTDCSLHCVQIVVVMQQNCSGQQSTVMHPRYFLRWLIDLPNHRVLGILIVRKFIDGRTFQLQQQLWPLCSSPCVSRHSRLRSGVFCRSKVLLPALELDARLLLTYTAYIPYFSYSS